MLSEGGNFFPCTVPLFSFADGAVDFSTLLLNAILCNNAQNYWQQYCNNVLSFGRHSLNRNPKLKAVSMNLIHTWDLFKYKSWKTAPVDHKDNVLLLIEISQQMLHVYEWNKIPLLEKEKVWVEKSQPKREHCAKGVVYSGLLPGLVPYIQTDPDISNTFLPGSFPVIHLYY